MNGVAVGGTFVAVGSKTISDTTGLIVITIGAMGVLVAVGGGTGVLVAAGGGTGVSVAAGGGTGVACAGFDVAGAVGALSLEELSDSDSEVSPSEAVVLSESVAIVAATAVSIAACAASVATSAVATWVARASSLPSTPHAANKNVAIVGNNTKRFIQCSFLCKMLCMHSILNLHQFVIR